MPLLTGPTLASNISAFTTFLCELSISTVSVNAPSVHSQKSLEPGSREGSPSPQSSPQRRSWVLASLQHRADRGYELSRQLMIKSPCQRWSRCATSRSCLSSPRIPGRAFWLLQSTWPSNWKSCKNMLNTSRALFRIIRPVFTTTSSRLPHAVRRSCWKNIVWVRSKAGAHEDAVWCALDSLVLRLSCKPSPRPKKLYTINSLSILDKTLSRFGSTPAYFVCLILQITCVFPNSSSKVNPKVRCVVIKLKKDLQLTIL